MSCRRCWSLLVCQRRARRAQRIFLGSEAYQGRSGGKEPLHQPARRCNCACSSSLVACELGRLFCSAFSLASSEGCFVRLCFVARRLRARKAVLFGFSIVSFVLSFSFVIDRFVRLFVASVKCLASLSFLLRFTPLSKALRALCGIALHGTVHPCTVLHCSALHSAALHCTALHGASLHHFAVLFVNARFEFSFPSAGLPSAG